MQKFVLKLFGFFKSCTQFIKILIVFLVLMLILYWIQDLTGGNWAWMSFISPVLDFLLDVGKAVWPGHMMLFAAVFEFKYLVALIVLGGLYALAHFGYIGLTALEDWFNDSCRFVRKIQEDQFNKSMEKKCISEQKNLKRYQIYVEAQVKPKFAHREYNINMDEQNQIMLKYLIDKTNTCPDKFENGYLFLILMMLYAPVLLLVVYSFNMSREIGIWSDEWGFSLYVELFQNQRFLQTSPHAIPLDPPAH